MNETSHDQQSAVAAAETESAEQLALSPGEVIIATFKGFDESGRLIVEDGSRKHHAQTTVDLKHSDIYKQVVLSFIGGNPQNPIVTGVVRSPLYDILDNPDGTESLLEELETAFDDQPNRLAQDETVNVDGKKVCIEGAEEVSLKCGDASITLTKAGKLLLRGKYLSSRSTGVNKILGGSVQVN